MHLAGVALYSECGTPNVETELDVPKRGPRSASKEKERMDQGIKLTVPCLHIRINPGVGRFDHQKSRYAPVIWCVGPPVYRCAGVERNRESREVGVEPSRTRKTPENA